MNYISHKSLVFAEFDDVKTKAINLENDLRTWAQVTQFREHRFYLANHIHRDRRHRSRVLIENLGSDHVTSNSTSDMLRRSFHRFMIENRAILIRTQT